jgi:hypothetical protein
MSNSIPSKWFVPVRSLKEMSLAELRSITNNQNASENTRRNAQSLINELHFNKQVY